MDERARLGRPSYVWRSGQTRRWQIIARWGCLERVNRVLDAGTGVGLYLRAFVEAGVPLAVGTEYEFARAARAAGHRGCRAVQAAEQLPFPDATFDLVLSHEVLEHVGDDRRAARELVRVLCPGGRAVIFVPNRLWPFETHGVFWRGRYHFGNVPLVNYLPNRWRNRLAPHVRAYTAGEVRRLFEGLPVRIVHHGQIFPGYDNLSATHPRLGRFVRAVTYGLERTPLQIVGLSHVLVVERM
ncbi:MAG: class I SAM-dependent methyltransferase [Ardenticatenia bacterium]|nr:class I SAM-dependent methyltransferase [Ardenticatenia bacterium]